MERVNNWARIIDAFLEGCVLSNKHWYEYYEDKDKFIQFENFVESLSLDKQEILYYNNWLDTVDLLYKKHAQLPAGSIPTEICHFLTLVNYIQETPQILNEILYLRYFTRIDGKDVAVLSYIKEDKYIDIDVPRCIWRLMTEFIEDYNKYYKVKY